LSRVRRAGPVQEVRRAKQFVRLAKLFGARKVAAARGQSLNQLIRDELSRLTGEQHRRADWQELESLSGTGHSGGWRFDRDEIHERA
jgi:hypothetical protein